jgi:anaerobic selenocysteine-containing dehydrogenase
MADGTDDWSPTACILCSVNCGVEVQARGNEMVRVRGDRRHPSSLGYTCEKARRLPFYQAGPRLTLPQRRRSDGSFETVGWDTAIADVATRLGIVRDEYGGQSILYYGGGAQGNHLCGVYARATRAALGSIYVSSAFAQEKTGELWVDAHLFGAVRHTAPDLRHAEVAVFAGKNPWQSHGYPRARIVLRELARDPQRSLIVIDPRRSETAAMADLHLAPRPGGDAYLLSAMLGCLLSEDLLNHDFLRERTAGADAVLAVLRTIDVPDYCRRAGVPEPMVRDAARRIGAAASVAVFEDLGIQHSPHSTLNSYLEKLLWLLTGNFGRPGTMNLHSSFAPGAIGGRRAVSRRTTPVTGHPIIGGQIPAAVIPETILTGHRERFRGLIVESANPVHSLPSSALIREAMAAVQFSVVIDVAMTETARCADYVLPTLTQFEKWECTLFTLDFPENVIHLREPVIGPPPGPLGEPEIHRRLVRALGALTDDDLAGLHQAAIANRAEFAASLSRRVQERPQLAGLMPVVLYETLGPTLPHGAQAAAALWSAAHSCAAEFPDSVRRAGIDSSDRALGDALFDAVVGARSGLVFTVDPYEESWARVAHPEGRLHIAIPELLEELSHLAREEAEPDPAYPMVLSAGERRSASANTVIRDPAWRIRDPHGALRVSVEDAERLGLHDGSRVQVITPDGSASAVVQVTDTLRPGHITLPNGYGLANDDGDQAEGVAPNELTSARRRDWLSGTPWHKHVPARLVPLP